jgi:hypothetical protein
MEHQLKMRSIVAKAAHSALFNLNLNLSIRDWLCSRISRLGNLSPLNLEMPWICYSAISYLEDWLKPGMNILEYGSGGSTLFFLRHECNIISIEHDPSWYNVVAASINRCANKDNSKLFLSVPVYTNETLDYKNESNCVSIDSGFDGYSFSSYVKHVDQYRDSTFDLILVDGRARRACLHYSASKVKPGGLIILDNSDRKYYLSKPISGLDMYEEHIMFRGSPPSSTSKTQCTIFARKLS